MKPCVWGQETQATEGSLRKKSCMCGQDGDKTNVTVGEGFRGWYKNLGGSGWSHDVMKGRVWRESSLTPGCFSYYPVLPLLFPLH